ncbi:GNAT family N-acetyltransferase [Streptomyces solicathayae]|uniref:GNAT family N-acetyltransferase n=1 Tax=Streptomyces solicathayae TaxID=3081768 RepID=A0ABZ0LLC0_9ACTN|nr:GNAT family N-acetyltransferase [Streptomyces sp. HUAS YS2]WOX20229.1 GNAT family N-acetyltransferase [Streptomyces sp. HUAS YS2]
MAIMGADDIDAAVELTAASLRAVTDRDWSVHASGLEWSCYDTAVHIGSDFTAYAGQLTGRATDAYVPFEIAADPGTTPEGLVRIIEATGGLLSAVVRTSPAELKAWHPFGSAGGDGFAAMGVLEVLLHTYDMLGALDVPGWQGPAPLCAKILDRLFPHTPRSDDPWQDLLWATGRAERPGLPRLAAWRWYADPLRGERLVLCEVSPRVADDLHAGGTGGFAWADAGPGEGIRSAAGRVVKARDEGRFRPGWGTYAIVRADDGLAVGGIGFHADPDGDGTAEIGYDVVESARGRGYATEAVQVLADWAFRQPGVAALRARADEDNDASRRVLARAGFAETGTVCYELRRPAVA